MNLNIGNKIRRLRKAKNLSQEALARLLGVSFQAVSKWETGTALPDDAHSGNCVLFRRVHGRIV